MIFEIGRVCVKTRGRDSGLQCVVVDKVDDVFVVVDGNTRRKKVNMAHLEPLDHVVEVKKNASTQDVLSALSALGFKVKDLTKKKEKKAVTAKPVAQKAVKKSDVKKKTDAKK